MNTSEMGVRYRYLLYLSTSSTLKYSSCLPEKAQYKIGILKSEMVTPINCSKIKETVYGEEGPFDNKNKQHLLVSKIQNMGKIVDHFWSMSSTSLVLSMLSTLSTLLMSRLREITSRLLLLFLGDPKKFSF